MRRRFRERMGASVIVFLNVSAISRSPKKFRIFLFDENKFKTFRVMKGSSRESPDAAKGPLEKTSVFLMKCRIPLASWDFLWTRVSLGHDEVLEKTFPTRIFFTNNLRVYALAARGARECHLWHLLYPLGNYFFTKFKNIQNSWRTVLQRAETSPE